MKDRKMSAKDAQRMAALLKASSKGLPLDLQDSKILRALLLLDGRPAHELQEKPLSVLTYLFNHGVVQRVPYSDYNKGRLWLCYETSLTEYGRAIMDAVRDAPVEVAIAQDTLSRQPA